MRNKQTGRIGNLLKFEGGALDNCKRGCRGMTAQFRLLRHTKFSTAVGPTPAYYRPVAARAHSTQCHNDIHVLAQARLCADLSPRLADPSLRCCGVACECGECADGGCWCWVR